MALAAAGRFTEMAKPRGAPRRPILSKAVIASLNALAKTTPATDETEPGLRYLRALVAYEFRPETIAKRAALSAGVQESKRKAKA